MAKAKYVNAFQAAYEQSEQHNLFMRHALHAKNEANKALRAQVAALEVIAKVGAHGPAAKSAKPARPAYVPTQDELDRVEAMAKAKALAMAGGQNVRVQLPAQAN
jgi:hypothetical protein